MLTKDIKKTIDNARDVLVGKIPNPQAQIEQITIAMIYKFMDDMDLETVEFGGERQFFAGDMEKYAWKAKIVDGALDEYVRRHDAIWDEMKQVLSDAGIVNYTIWNVGNELFGYYECEKGIEFAEMVCRCF